jgi:hypothetical protein
MLEALILWRLGSVDRTLDGMQRERLREGEHDGLIAVLVLPALYLSVMAWPVGVLVLLRRRSSSWPVALLVPSVSGLLVWGLSGPLGWAVAGLTTTVVILGSLLFDGVLQVRYDKDSETTQEART